MNCGAAGLLCCRNHVRILVKMLEECGPIFVDTPTAMAKLAESMTPVEIKIPEAEASENSLNMTIGQCGVWAAENIEPDKEMSELMPIKPDLFSSHAEGRIAAKSMVQFTLDNSDSKPELTRSIEYFVEDVYRPVRTFL